MVSRCHVSIAARILPAALVWLGAAQANPWSSSGAATVILRESTPVLLAFTGSLSSRTAANGDPVSLVLVNDLRVGRVTVARAGCKVLGHITYVKKAAPPGRSGALNLQLDYLDAGAAKIKLSASGDKGGVSDIRYSLPYHLKWPMGALRTGDDVEIKPGTMLTVFVSQDISLPAAE
jgi:hypothetical protein